jgi:hypothetical protein
MPLSQLSPCAPQAARPSHNIVKNAQLTVRGVVASESDSTIAGVNRALSVFEVAKNLCVVIRLTVEIFCNQAVRNHFSPVDV